MRHPEIRALVDEANGIACAIGRNTHEMRDGLTAVSAAFSLPTFVPAKYALPGGIARLVEIVDEIGERQHSADNFDRQAIVVYGLRLIRADIAAERERGR